jgi:hypothetical protein
MAGHHHNASHDNRIRAKNNRSDMKMQLTNEDTLKGFLGGYSSSLALSLVLAGTLGTQGMTIALWLAFLAALGLFIILFKNRTKLPGDTQ